MNFFFIFKKTHNKNVIIKTLFWQPLLDTLMPKKTPLHEVKCKDHVKLYAVNGELLFFQQRDGPFYPHLKLLHKYPNLLSVQKVDKGAIRFVLSGANIMCPGKCQTHVVPCSSCGVAAILCFGATPSTTPCCSHVQAVEHCVCMCVCVWGGGGRVHCNANQNTRLYTALH